jgi:hypothetical protein
MSSSVRMLARRALVGACASVLVLGAIPAAAADSPDELTELAARAWQGEPELLAEVYASDGVHSATFFDRTNVYEGPEEVAAVAGLLDFEIIGPRIDIPLRVAHGAGPTSSTWPAVVPACGARRLARSSGTTASWAKSPQTTSPGAASTTAAPGRPSTSSPSGWLWRGRPALQRPWRSPMHLARSTAPGSSTRRGCMKAPGRSHGWPVARSNRSAHASISRHLRSSWPGHTWSSVQVRRALRDREAGPVSRIRARREHRRPATCSSLRRRDRQDAARRGWWRGRGPAWTAALRRDLGPGGRGVGCVCRRLPGRGGAARAR